MSLVLDKQIFTSHARTGNKNALCSGREKVKRCSVPQARCVIVGIRELYFLAHSGGMVLLLCS